MSNSGYSETRRVSWLERLQRSLSGIVVGLLMVAGMIFLLFWNEGRAVTTARSLAEGAGIVVSVPADRIDPVNEGQLVHVTGAVTTSVVPADTFFAIKAPGLRLVRRVEMFQWKETARSETSTKLGGGQETVTTYDYSKDWSDRPIESASFRQGAQHNNPPMEIRGQEFLVPSAKLGAFTLDGEMVDRIGGIEPLPLGPDEVALVDAAYTGPLKVSGLDNRIYLGWDPTAPEIGDYRISYERVPAETISVVGAQRGTSFESYQTQAGDSLLMVQSGTVGAKEMFGDAEAGNTLLTWILRIVAVVILYLGFALMLAPLAVIADVVPPLGFLVRTGTGIVAFVLTLVAGSLTIAIAWLAYRPFVALGVLVAGCLVAAAASLFRCRRAPALSAS